MSWVPLIVGVGRLAYQAAKGNKEKEVIQNQEYSQESTRIDIDALVHKIQKTWLLKNQGILDQDEFQKQKFIMLNSLESNGTIQPPMECLRSMMPLVESGAMSVDEMKHVKAIIEGNTK